MDVEQHAESDRPSCDERRCAAMPAAFLRFVPGSAQARVLRERPRARDPQHLPVRMYGNANRERWWVRADYRVLLRMNHSVDPRLCVIPSCSPTICDVPSPCGISLYMSLLEPKTGHEKEGKHHLPTSISDHSHASDSSLQRRPH